MYGPVIVQVFLLSILCQNAYAVSTSGITFETFECNGKTLTVYASVELTYSESEQLCDSTSLTLLTIADPRKIGDLFHGCNMPKKGFVWISKTNPQGRECYVLASNGQDITQVKAPCNIKAITICEIPKAGKVETNSKGKYHSNFKVESGMFVGRP